MKTVLITGTSTGIGFETALALGRAGYIVYAGMRVLENTPALKEVAHKESLPITIVQLNVDSDESVQGSIDKILNESGHIDVLVNNAGLGTIGPVEELPIEEFKKVMDTNFFGALRCIQAVLPGMRNRKSGCIINISSIMGRMVFAPMGPYSASKFALEALSEAIAQEVKSFGIRTVIVEPGTIKTPMLDKARLIPPVTCYSHERRFQALMSAILENPVFPSTVADKIVEIVMSDSWQLRYPVGPGAESILQWRSSVSDEEWIDLWATENDNEWYKKIKDQIGLDVRPKG